LRPNCDASSSVSDALAREYACLAEVDPRPTLPQSMRHIREVLRLHHSVATQVFVAVLSASNYTYAEGRLR
jgi:hypothetical protein